MKKLNYQIQTLDPIIISSESGNQFMVPTRDYIPGGVILGGLAYNYLKNNTADKKFYDLFVNGKVNYSNAYKVDKFNGQEITTYPLPNSIQHLKNDGEIIHDLLYFDPQEQTKPINGYGRIEKNSIYKTSVYKSTAPHHERDYDTGAPKQNVFFNYESINANQNFSGTISSEDDLIIDEFKKLFSSLNEIRIGRSKSSEYGKVKLTISEYSGNAVDIELNEDDTISLTFLSNVIIYNENGVPTTAYTHLGKLLKEKIAPNIKIEKAFLKIEEIESYVSVWKLKRPSEVSFQAGSCLLLKVDKDSINKLMELQTQGIGERKHEGYGQIVFGLQKNPAELKKILSDKISIAKPTGTPPEFVKNITRKLAQEYLQKIAAVEALKIVHTNSQGLDKKITSSQIGRMEGILRISESENKFKDKIKVLRKTSRDKLKGCILGNTNLFLLLTEFDLMNYSKIESAIGSISTLFSDVEIGESELDGIKNGLYVSFYLNLFAAMRKAIKGGK